ncbi:hypothetical protein Tco_0273657 [Tanacetum coccineum]
MDLETAQITTTTKLPTLKQGKYDMWRLRIEQYFQVQDYTIWDVIENGNSFKPAAKTTIKTDGTSTILIPGPVTTEEKIQKKNDMKTRSFRRLNKPDLDTMSFDDLYNNFKIVKLQVKGTARSSSSSISTANTQVSPASTQVSTASTQVSTANLIFCSGRPPDTTYPPVGYDVSNLLPIQRNDFCRLNNVSAYLTDLLSSVSGGAIQGCSEHKDANEHIEKVLVIVDLFHIPEVTQHQIMLRASPMSLTGAVSRCLRNEPSGAIPTKTVADAKVAIQEMAKYSQKWHNGTSSKTRSIETSDGLAAIQAQLNSLRREIKKVNEKVYAAQVGCEVCKGPYYTKDYPIKEKGKTLEEAYYTQFGAPYQPGRQYKVEGPEYYQRNNGNSSYPD